MCKGTGALGHGSAAHLCGARADGQQAWRNVQPVVLRLAKGLRERAESCVGHGPSARRELEAAKVGHEERVAGVRREEQRRVLKLRAHEGEGVPGQVQGISGERWLHTRRPWRRMGVSSL